MAVCEARCDGSQYSYYRSRSAASLWRQRLERVAICVDEALDSGDDLNSGMWLRVLDVIDAWQRQEGNQTRH
jgi:hypothetical protein